MMEAKCYKPETEMEYIFVETSQDRMKTLLFLCDVKILGIETPFPDI